MPEHFPTFNRAARLVRSASPVGRTFFQRIGRALATERGLLRAGLYVLMFLALSFHAVALLESALQAAGGNTPAWTFYTPYGRTDIGPSDNLIDKALVLYSTLLRAVFGASQFATLAIFACLVALVATSERPSTLEVGPRKSSEES